MRSNRGIFWYSLGLTLLLLLPMVLTVAFFTDQYQKQQLLRQASAADSTLRIEPGAQGVVNQVADEQCGEDELYPNDVEGDDKL